MSCNKRKIDYYSSVTLCNSFYSFDVCHGMVYLLSEGGRASTVVHGSRSVVHKEEPGADMVSVRTHPDIPTPVQILRHNCTGKREKSLTSSNGHGGPQVSFRGAKESLGVKSSLLKYSLAT